MSLKQSGSAVCFVAPCPQPGGDLCSCAYFACHRDFPSWFQMMRLAMDSPEPILTRELSARIHSSMRQQQWQRILRDPDGSPQRVYPSKGFHRRRNRYGRAVRYSSRYRPISSNGMGLKPIFHAGESSLRRKSPLFASTKPGSVSIRTFPPNFSMASLSPK